MYCTHSSKVYIVYGIWYSLKIDIDTERETLNYRFYHF